MQKRIATKRAREKGVLFVFMCITIFLLLLRIYIQGEVDSLNWTHYELTEETKAVHRENIELENRIAHYTSLTYIASWSASQGFVPVTYRILWE